MTVAQRLVKSTGYLTAARLGGDVIYFLFYVLLSRAFGREGIGLYSFALELTGTLFIMADYGLSVYLVRELSRKREQLPKYLGSFLVLKLAFTVFGVVVLALLTPFLRLDPRSLWVLVIIACAQAIYWFGELFKAAFAVHERLSEVAFLELLYKGGVFVLGSCFLAWHWPLERVLVAFLLSAGVYLATLLLITWQRLGAPRCQFDPAIMREALTAPFPFFLSSILMDLHFSIAIILVKLLQGEAACGVFSVPCKLVSALSVAVLFYRVALFPALSRLHHESREGHRVLYRNSFKYVSLVFVPAAVFAGLGARSIIQTIFGSQFEASVPVMQALSPVVFLVAMRHLLVATLGSVNAQGRLVQFQGLGVLTGLLVSLALIPRWGPVGAAAALGLAELVVVACAARMASRMVEPLAWGRLLAKPVLAAALMGIVLLFVRHASLLIVLPAAVGSGLAALLAIGGIRTDDVRFVKNALQPNLRRVSL